VAGNTVWQSATATAKNLNLETSLASRLLTQLGLQNQLQQNPYRLSGGELRRLALVSALAHHPSHLMLDEPTVGQDAETWQAVAGVILAAKRAGVDVTLATHDAELIALADEVIQIVPAATSSAVPPRTGRVAPLAALLISMGLLGGSFAIGSVETGAIALGVEAALALMCWRILPQQKAKRFVPILIALASIWLSNALFAADGVNLQALERALVVTLRVAFFALPSVVLAGALRPAELAAALVRWCRVPARPAVAAAAALVRLEFIQWQWAAVREARRLRGFNEGHGPVARTKEFMASLFALLVQSLRSAGELAVAMQARGFAEPTAKRRTWVKF
jgi:energy-coupling factor transport system ATP-binding protein